MNAYEILQNTQRERVSDGVIAPVLAGWESSSPSAKLLFIALPQLGDFDSLEYAWWLHREADHLRSLNITLRAVGIGDRASGQQFCEYTGFAADALFMDTQATLHRELGLYQGVTRSWPGLQPGQSAWVNLMLMCAGIGSPGTLAEVFRGYRGDRAAPQLIADDEAIATNLLPPLKGDFFALAGGRGFQRSFELATLRLRNMVEVLGKWDRYVPDAQYMTQRGGTFLFDRAGNLLYEHRDRGILGFAANMAQPLAFLDQVA
ncbi:MAG: hypothetical protein EA001_02830 [Oscillatoriales cyanobacterium]|nr:MAG: hypothetical protein EA001_02830 [Oscillatoriales cyanobacterium]